MPMREAEAVLEEWRRVERELENAAPGSRDEDRLQALAAQLRDEYQRLVDDLKTDGVPAESRSLG